MPDRSPFDVGYWLSSEEHAPTALVACAVRAEVTGFPAAMISDHFHPWTPTQGNAPFVWAVLGAIAHATSTLHLATGVTSPICRTHPALVAHAAATIAVMADGRFALGLGTGERLNEHVTGVRWSRPGVRRAMLVEAVGVIRRLLGGTVVNHEGEHFTVEHAQLYTVPAVPPPIWVAAGGPRGAKVAGEIGDGLISVAADPSLVDAYEAAGGSGPRVGQLHVCVAASDAEAVRIARRWWAHGVLAPQLVTELARPEEFAAAAADMDDDAITRAVLCSADAARHIEALGRFAAAGYDRVYVHQVGPDQDALFELYERDVLPAIGADTV